jgi:hypothetical protein
MAQTTTFRSIFALNSKVALGQTASLARDLLPDRVAQSFLHWWSPGEALPTSARFLLLGVAVWSGYDMNLLDHLDKAVATSADRSPTVFVFDADRCTSQDDFQRIIPDIGFVHHTPVVGYWENGKLADKGCGYEGRQLVARLYGIDEQLLHQRITAAS